MSVSDVIRKYRKDKNITQDEMARRLGVSAPAVNKWENGHCLPDVALLSPIARLLGISTDTLLCHEKELSPKETNRLVEEAHEKLKAEEFDAVFEWAKQCLAEYPNCHPLTLWMAQTLDSHLTMHETPHRERYDGFLLDGYERVLQSGEEATRRAAAEALFYFYIGKDQYQQAEAYLPYFSAESPERKRKQALIFSKTGRQEEACKMYEELLYAGYQSLSAAFQELYMLALHESHWDRARLWVEKIRDLARLFEFGEYHEVSPGLELATLEKNEAETLRIMERMLANLESLYGFTKSPLFSHMEFKTPSGAFLAEVREDLIEGFRDEDVYGFLKENQRWRALVGF